MKKTLALVIAVLVLVSPVCFANPVCDYADSEDYAKAASGKLARGIGNAAFSFLELFRQPLVNENKYEGMVRGPVHTVGRAAAGALEAGTALIPGAKVPQMSPACPTDMLKV